MRNRIRCYKESPMCLSVTLSKSAENDRTLLDTLRIGLCSQCFPEPLRPFTYSPRADESSLIDHIMICHGLHQSWASRRQESFRIHGQPTSEILAIFMGQPTSAESEKDVRHFYLNKKSRRRTSCVYLDNKSQRKGQMFRKN